MKNTKYGAHHYVIFSTFLLLPLAYVPALRLPSTLYLATHVLFPFPFTKWTARRKLCFTPQESCPSTANFCAISSSADICTYIHYTHTQKHSSAITRKESNSSTWTTPLAHISITTVHSAPVLYHTKKSLKSSKWVELCYNVMKRTK